MLFCSIVQLYVILYVEVQIISFALLRKLIRNSRTKPNESKSRDMYCTNGNHCHHLET